jgi:hypothetical protein
MMDEILRSTIAAESDIAIVSNHPGELEEGGDRLGAYTRRRRIDVVVLSTPGDDAAVQDRIVSLLRANARLGVVAIDGASDTGTLHRLVPTRDAIEPLTAGTIADAIRAGAGHGSNRGLG